MDNAVPKGFGASGFNTPNVGFILLFVFLLIFFGEDLIGYITQKEDFTPIQIEED